jgi:hypothetical protein
VFLLLGFYPIGSDDTGKLVLKVAWVYYYAYIYLGSHDCC